MVKPSNIGAHERKSRRRTSRLFPPNRGPLSSAPSWRLTLHPPVDEQDHERKLNQRSRRRPHEATVVGHGQSRTKQTRVMMWTWTTTSPWPMS